MKIIEIMLDEQREKNNEFLEKSNWTQTNDSPLEKSKKKLLGNLRKNLRENNAIILELRDKE